MGASAIFAVGSAIGLAVGVAVGLAMGADAGFLFCFDGRLTDGQTDS